MSLRLFNHMADESGSCLGILLDDLGTRPLIEAAMVGADWKGRCYANSLDWKIDCNAQLESIATQIVGGCCQM